VLGVGVVAAFLATLNRPGIGLVITGLVAGLTALAALKVRPAIPESGVPPEAPDAPDAFRDPAATPALHGTPSEGAHRAPQAPQGAGNGTSGVPEPEPPHHEQRASDDAQAVGDPSDNATVGTPGDAQAVGDPSDNATVGAPGDGPAVGADGPPGDSAAGTAPGQAGHGAPADAAPPFAGAHPTGAWAPQWAPWPGTAPPGGGVPGPARAGAYPAGPWAHHGAPAPGYAGPVAAEEPARPDRYAYTWSAVFGVLAAVLLATAALRDAGWVLVWTLSGAFLLASMAFATRNPASRRNAVGVATGAFALLRNLPSAPRFLLSSLNTRRASGIALPLVLTSIVTLGLLLVFGLLFALADPVFAAYLQRMFTSVGTGSGVLRLFGMLVTMLLTGAAVLTARRHHRPRVRPAAPAPAPLWPVWVWTVPLFALVALFIAFVGVQAAVMFGGDDYVQRVTGVVYAEYARQGFFQLVVVSGLVLGVIAVAVRLLPARDAGARTLRNALLGLLCVLTLVILASAMMRLQLYTEVFGLTRLRISAQAWILWSAGVFGLVIAAGAVNTFGRSAAWLPRVTVAFSAAALAVFAYGDPDLRIAESHHDLDLSAVDTDYLSGLSADAVPGLMGLPEDERTCALIGLRDRLDDPDGRGPGAWNLSRVQGREQLAELGLFNDVSGIDCGTDDFFYRD
jgi:hypothetical protein